MGKATPILSPIPFRSRAGAGVFPGVTAAAGTAVPGSVQRAGGTSGCSGINLSGPERSCWAPRRPQQQVPSTPGLEQLPIGVHQ